MPPAERMPIAEAVRWACVLEVCSPKAGNVHPSASFADATWQDFIESAEAIAPVLAREPASGVGPAILECVRATQQAVGHNTNLGIILLLAPLCAAPVDRPLREGAEHVLASLTVADARAAFEAIRLAKPGGLGSAAQEDVKSDPRVTLLEAMRLAAGRDVIARQYCTGFATVFDHVVPDLAAAAPYGSLAQRIAIAHLKQMAREPDSLIARKCGDATAAESMGRALAVVDSGWPRHPASASAFEDFDRWLRADGHRRNPGTSADLIAAGLFVALREGLIRPPFHGFEGLL